MTYQIASDVGRIVAASHVILLTALFVQRMSSYDRIYALFMGLGAAAFLISPILFAAKAAWFIILPVFLLQIGMTFWFWMLALSQGREHFRPKWWHWLLLLAKIMLTLVWVNARRTLWSQISPSEEFVWRALLPALISFGFVVAAVFASGNRLDADLVEDRRSLRRLLVLWGAAAILAAMAIVLILRGPMLTEIGDWLTVAISLSVCVSLHFWLAQSGPEISINNHKSIVLESSDLKQLAQQIEELFESEAYYCTEGLTVRALSTRLETHEYKVRRAINGVLGYRNFNAFLNQHRVAAAKARLLAEPELPILRLAMDLGYRSLAVFNKAFKEVTGRTPTDFRRAEGPASAQKTD